MLSNGWLLIKLVGSVFWMLLLVICCLGCVVFLFFLFLFLFCVVVDVFFMLVCIVGFEDMVVLVGWGYGWWLSNGGVVFCFFFLLW